MGSVTRLRVVGVGLALNDTEGTADFATNANLSDYLWDNTQLNHDRDFSSPIHPHIHWFQAQNNTPNWLLHYRWHLNGGAKVTSWTYLPCNTNAFAYTSGTILQISYGAAIVAPASSNVSDIIQFRIYRDNANTSAQFGGADAYSAVAGMLSFDCHIELDSNGSIAEYHK